jgi:REP element-mobilizing transposase RayT
MPTNDYVNFQTRTQPLAYLITFRCYGTWLHGEERGSIDRRHYHRYGTPDMPANKRILAEERLTLKTYPIVLTEQERETVEAAIGEVCAKRKYSLYAVSVRTNHVHVVVGSVQKPEFVMGSFKSYATRRLRETHVLSTGERPWSRHGSTKYLWTEDQLKRAIEYVQFGQGDEPFR